MLDVGYVRGLSMRCHALARNCFDLAAATELRRIGDELAAKAADCERVALVPADSEVTLAELA